VFWKYLGVFPSDSAVFLSVSEVITDI